MALNLDQQITPPTPPNLGTANVVYDQGFFTQSFGGLNVYFSRLTALFSALFGRRGGKWINSPYGAFQDSTDQTAANTTTAYAVTFDTTDFSNGVTLSNSSRLNVAQAGIYNLQFSIPFKNTTNDTQDVDVWFRKNGTDIAGSNSKFSVPNKHGSIKGHLIAALNFYNQVNAGDYVEIMWSTTNTAVILEQIPTQTSPTRPSTPSVIVTANKVDESSTSDVYASNQIQGQCTVNHFANSTANKTYKYVVLG